MILEILHNNLTIAGDLAQAVHLGTSSTIPREDNEPGSRLRNFSYDRLEGSYRLPYRVSECIRPISETIQNDQKEAELINPYKGSPPGARPIIVAADNDEQMATKLKSVLDRYQHFDVVNPYDTPPRKITILEKDHDLTRALSAIQNNIAETDTILRLKGLEKTCVLWSTKSNIENHSEIINFVYTIMSRTAGLLIIALFPECPVEYVKILRMLRSKDRLIFWDSHSEERFNYLIKQNETV